MTKSEDNAVIKALVTLADKPIAEKYKGKPTEEIAEHIIQEIEAILVERFKIIQENGILAAWETGKELRKCEKDHKLSISQLVNRVALDNRLTGRHMGERSLWTAIKVFDAFPRFEKVYETEYGQSITISKLKKMLSTPKARIEKTIKQMAVELMERLGTDKARDLAKQIIVECDKEDKRG